MITRQKHKLFTAFAIISVFCALICAVLSACNDDEIEIGEQTVSYEQIYGYTLVLNEYTVPDADNVVKIVDPDGIDAAFSGNPFIPTMVGEYTIVYGNKTETLNVLISSDSMVINIENTLEQEYVAGNTIVLPSATISDDYKTYQTYDVNVIADGTTISSYKNIKSGVNVGVELNVSGKYKLEYVCVDGFGQTNKQIVEFDVVDQPTVVYEKIDKDYSYGEKIEFGMPFGFFKGEKYAAEIIVRTPSEKEIKVADGEYVFTEVGEHTVKFKSVINGESAEYTENVSVFYSAKNLVDMYNGEMEVNKPLPQYSSVLGSGAVVKGMSDFVLNYEQIIDLNDFTKDDNIITFLPIADTNGQLTDLTLTLTDIYDETNALTFYWYAKEHWGIGHSYLTVKRPNGTYGISNEDSSQAQADFGKVRSEGAVIYGGSFFGERNGASDLFSLQYDVSENIAYCTVRNKQWKLLDVDDDPAIEFKDRFYGFTTGEVYLKIETVNNKNAGICIVELAGTDFGGRSVNVEKYKENYLKFDKYKASLPVGEIGLEYPVPTVNLSGNCSDSADFSLKILFNGAEQPFEDNGGFVPKAAGEYTAKWQGTYKGFPIEKAVEFNIVQSLGEISLSFDEPLTDSIVSGESLRLPSLVISGISGEYKTEIVVKDSAQTFAPDLFGEYVLNTDKDHITVEIHVEDTELTGRHKEFAYQISVIRKTVLLINGEIPNAVRAGTRIVLPDFGVYNGSALEKKIIIDEGLSGEKVLMPNESFIVPAADFMTVRYVAGKDTPQESDREKYTYTVKIISKDADIKELLNIDNATVAQFIDGEDGLSMTVDKVAESVSLFSTPYSLPTNELKISFSLRKDKMNFGSVRFAFTDSVRADKQIVLTLSDIVGERATLRINGHSTDYVIKYSATANLYNFTFIFSGYSNAILNFSGSKIAELSDFTDGTPFNGFSFKLAYLSVTAESVSGESEFVLNEIANQQFGYYMTAFGKPDNDNSGPVIYSDYGRSIIDAEYDSTVILPEFYAKDVLQSTSVIKFSVIDPTGTTIIKNAEVSKDVSFKAQLYGNYIVLYTAQDSIGNKTEKRLTVSVKDKILPTITVNGSYNKEYKLGGNIEIATATATDNNSANMTIRVFVMDSACRLTLVDFGDKITLSREGTYKVIYRVEDDDLNIAYAQFEFNVKA